MNRVFKILPLMALGVILLGVLGATGAQASPEFHCSTAPCRLTLDPDGTSTTAHQVFVIKNSASESVSFTCKRITGSATSAGAAPNEALLTGIAYHECNANGEPVSVRMNKCGYLITASGQVTIQGCEAGKKIELEITTTGCIATVGEQGPLSGLSFHNIVEEGGVTKEVTTQAKVPGVAVEFDGTKAKCLIDPTKTPLSAEYLTGNTIATGETGPGPGRDDIWWTE